MTAPGWPPGPREPRLRRGEIHVWLAQLDGPQANELRDALTPAELSRAAAIVRLPARERWSRSRALLRLLLGRYVGLAPKEVPLNLQDGGRPYVEMAPDFSISHSRGLALYAFAAEGRVGVDIEVERDELSVQELTDWTRREAAFKCAAAEPSLHSLDLGPAAVGALATTIQTPRMRLWTLHTDPGSPPAERRGRPTGALI